MVEQEEKKEIVATTTVEEPIWMNSTEEQKQARLQEVIAAANKLSPFTDRTDAHRSEDASGSGGFELRDDEQTRILKSAVGEIVAVSVFKQAL